MADRAGALAGAASARAVASSSPPSPPSSSAPPDLSSPSSRLALELDAALAADPLVDELAFVPRASPADVFGPDPATHPAGAVTSATTPGAFTLVEHKLAIAASAIVPLHAFASAAFLRSRAAEDAARRRERGDDAEIEIEPGVDPATGADAARLLLLVNGDHTTAWNARKRRASRRLARSFADPNAGDPAHAREDVADAELRHAELILSKFPKAQACWAHRRWILLNVLGLPTDDDERSNTAAAALFANEARVAERAARTKRLNYAAWAHRRWCARGAAPVDAPAPSRASAANGSVRNRGEEATGSDPTPFAPRHRGLLRSRAAIEAELAAAAARARRNVSDYCGLHYRQALLLGGGGGGEAPTAAAIEREAALAGELIARYPGREALWAHRRFVFHAWAEARAAEGVSRGEAGGEGGSLSRGGGGGVFGDVFGDAFASSEADGSSPPRERVDLEGELAFAGRWLPGEGSEVEAAPSSVHAAAPEWAERPAVEQARLAAAHRLWTLEAAARFGLATGLEADERRARATEALARVWPRGRRAAEGLGARIRARGSGGGAAT